MPPVLQTARRVCTDATARLLLSQDTLEIGGVTLAPDPDVACLEFHLSHAFPVRTTDRTAILPATLARCGESLRHKMLNLAHLVRSYNREKIARDRILGCIPAVELVGDGRAIARTKAAAAYLRCGAVLYRAAEGAETILENFLPSDGAKKAGQWSVSMENRFAEDEAWIGCRGDAGHLGAPDTPDELRACGYAAWPLAAAPAALRQLVQLKPSARVTRDWEGRETTLFVGGVDGALRYNGAGLTPLGKEKEAEIVTCLASEPLAETDELLLGLLAGFQNFFAQVATFVTPQVIPGIL